METADVVIIGAGVVGLAAAAAVSGAGRSILVLERHETFGQETSSRNSEVIHAGIYHPKDSLKAKSCVEGNRLIYEICRKNNIYHARTGKIIVATNERELGDLNKLYENGVNNGVELRLIDRGEMKRLEPNVEGVAAIHSPSTGIIDSHGLMKYFASAAAEKGCDIVYGAAVEGIEKQSSGYKVTVRDAGGEPVMVSARGVVNCAGLESDRVAAMAGIDIQRAGYALHMCKGVYFNVGGGKSSRISRLVYPVPNRRHGVLGIHAMINLAGRMRLGPDSEFIERDRIDYHVDESKKEKFLKGVQPFLPFIEADDLTPDTAGIRPKLHGPEESFRDFVVRHEEDRGFPGLINLIGIESPGLTASPAIGRMVGKMVEEIL